MPPKPKRAPKAKKVEAVNSDSDSEFGIPKKTAAPKGKHFGAVLLSTHVSALTIVFDKEAALVSKISTTLIFFLVVNHQSITQP